MLFRLGSLPVLRLSLRLAFEMPLQPVDAGVGLAVDIASEVHIGVLDEALLVVERERERLEEMRAELAGCDDSLQILESEISEL